METGGRVLQAEGTLRQRPRGGAELGAPRVLGQLGRCMWGGGGEDTGAHRTPGSRPRGSGSGDHDRCSPGRGRRGTRSPRRSFLIGTSRLTHGVRPSGRHHHGFPGGLRAESHERLFPKPSTPRVLGVIELSHQNRSVETSCHKSYTEGSRSLDEGISLKTKQRKSAVQ